MKMPDCFLKWRFFFFFLFFLFVIWQILSRSGIKKNDYCLSFWHLPGFILTLSILFDYNQKINVYWVPICVIEQAYSL